jgi:hypothetical protein
MAVIFQCTACRALGAAVDVVVALDGTRAGLVCGLCRFTSWLPVSGAAEVASTATAPTLPPALPPAPLPTLALPPLSTSTSTSTPTSEPFTLTPVVPAAAPAETSPTKAPAMASAASTTTESAVAVTGGLAELERVRARIATLPAPNEAQTMLNAQFEQLLSSSWGNTGAHKTLLKAAALHGELAFVGNRYRAVLDVVRDEPQAKAAQQELLTLAMATMQNSKDLARMEPKGTSSTTLIVGGLIAIALAVGGVLVVKSFIGTMNKMDQIDK